MDRKSKKVAPENAWNAFSTYTGVKGHKKDGRVTYRAQDPKLPRAYVFDIDGTLAHMVDRSPYDHNKVGTDVPNFPVVQTALDLQSAGARLLFVSGRKEVCRGLTVQWLRELGLKVANNLFMRGNDDNRKDNYVKEDLYRDFVEGVYYVVAVFDDRDQVVNHLRYKLHYPVFQVAPGNF